MRPIYTEWYIQVARESWQDWRMLREQKITFGQLRQSGFSRLDVFCGDYRCRHSVAIDIHCWPGSLRLADLQSLFVCTVCGHRGADVRPDLEQSHMVSDAPVHGV